MLELQDIRKVYNTGGQMVEALKGVSLKFRESEFVSILGQSGCGKTTLLNIIGGLDRYTTGDLIIDGRSTKQFRDRDWDAYRNYKVGFVFQSYNLIGHQTVLSNVELALTIGGIPKKERREKAIKALRDVGLEDHIYKKPNQLSGGQMQRVAIARALVNDPEIILADEPTGALDTKTSVQVMEILKKISKDKLIIMVTHNKELAEEYSSRIIKILDGVIMEDSNPITPGENLISKVNRAIGRTKMKLFTAFRLSLNNLLTKKGRTVLIAFAGSIGIIGIALIQATSNGFQNYVDSIQEETLSSYPLTIMQESTDITGMLLSMRTAGEGGEQTGNVQEKQYISELLASIKSNDLKSLNKHINANYKDYNKDISTVKYGYSVDPLIYTVDSTNEIVKLNPSNLFSNMLGGSSLLSSYSNMGSIFGQMVDNTKNLEDSYDVLAGKWPTEYNEMIIVLSEPDSISDLLVYSLGLRDNDELTEMVTKIMQGEAVENKNTPMSFTYQDLMNVKLKLIRPTDLYRYNEKYDVYEDITKEKDTFQEVYNNSPDLKIVGIVSPKEGVTSMALNPGVAYTSKLIDYIIDYSSKTEIVKKQLENKEIDVISNNRFDAKENELGLSFQDLVSVDEAKLKEAFGGKIDQSAMEKETQGTLQEISEALSTDTGPAKEAFNNAATSLIDGFFKAHSEGIDATKLAQLESMVDTYLAGDEASAIINDLNAKYLVPADVFKQTYKGLIASCAGMYVQAYMTAHQGEMILNIPIDQAILAQTKTALLNNAAYIGACEKVAQGMTEALMKMTVLTKVGQLMTNTTTNMAKAFNVDPAKIAGAFKLAMSEEEITRIITAMMTKKQDNNQKTNLIALGYQDKEEPTYISYYFTSFDGKERFISFLEDYNDEMLAKGLDEKKIQYSDTTGILMSSVKTIVNAVTYVLIAFVSISLIVSSIMIGIITYISVYERTKEIGILRAIGASKGNISSIFNAETMIIGLLSGLFGIGISYGLVPIINMILHSYIGNIPLYVVIFPQNAIALVILSVILTFLGGLIPAGSASQKDPVIALRTE